MPEILFAPRTHAFAVVRMDPVAMVRHLGDPEATRAAEALSPKSYVVFVDLDSALPFPGKPWYGFTVYLIGPCPPAPNEDDCISPEMCIPIFPNASHPEGREPVRPQPAFPFDNCYFWSELSMEIRVCSEPNGFDWEHTTLLGAQEYAKWKRYRSEDMVRRVVAQRARALPDPSVHSIDVHDSEAAGADVGSVYANSYFSYSSYASEYGDTESVNTLMEMGLVVDPSVNFELQPLFHLWGDLAANIKQGAIPSPVQLLAECDAITRIIQEARERDPTLPPLPVPNPFGSAAPPDSENDTSIHGWLSEIRPRRFRTPKALRKLGRQLRNVLRLPYIPVWP